MTKLPRLNVQLNDLNAELMQVLENDRVDGSHEEDRCLQRLEFLASTLLSNVRELKSRHQQVVAGK